MLEVLINTVLTRWWSLPQKLIGIPTVRSSFPFCTVCSWVFESSFFESVDKKKRPYWMASLISKKLSRIISDHEKLTGKVSKSKACFNSSQEGTIHRYITTKFPLKHQLAQSLVRKKRWSVGCEWNVSNNSIDHFVSFSLIFPN